MQSKGILLLVIILIIVVAGAWWLLSGEESLEVDTELDTPETVLSALGSKTGFVFGEQKETSIQWMVEENGQAQTLSFAGNGFEVKGVSSDDQKIVERFFADNGFTVDQYNIADGTVSGLIGYAKDDIACTVTSKMWLDEEGLPLEDDKNDVEVRCAKMESIKDQEMTVGDLLESGIYDENITASGAVAMLGELLCSCFELSSGGQTMQVWYDTMVEDDDENGLVCCKTYGLGAEMEEVNVEYSWMPESVCVVPENFVGGGKEKVKPENCDEELMHQWPAVSVEGIQNGDEVIVSGQLKSEGDNRGKNDFWIISIEKVEQSAGLANPAAVYCEDEMNGVIEIKTTDEGQAGYCVLEDGRKCEEWALFNSDGEECAEMEEE